MPARHLRVDRQTIILQNYAGAGGDACYGLRHGGRPALWRLHDARQLEIIGNRPSNLVPVGPILSPGSGITCHYHQADDQQASCQIPQCNCPRGCGQRPNAHWRCCREGDPRYSHDPPPLSLRWKPALHSAGTFKHNFVEFRVSPKLCYLNAIICASIVFLFPTALFRTAPLLSWQTVVRTAAIPDGGSGTKSIQLDVNPVRSARTARAPPLSQCLSSQRIGIRIPDGSR
jgi:hypothetical protein